MLYTVYLNTQVYTFMCTTLYIVLYTLPCNTSRCQAYSFRTSTFPASSIIYYILCFTLFYKPYCSLYCTQFCTVLYIVRYTTLYIKGFKSNWQSWHKTMFFIHASSILVMKSIFYNVLCTVDCVVTHTVLYI